MFPMHHVPSIRRTTDDLPRALAAAAVAIALAGLFLASLALLTSTPATTGKSAAIDPAEVRDGWSSYLGAAAPEPVADVVDGWSSYLTPRAPTVVDGWSSYLLVDEIDPNTVVDGWMSRYGGHEE